MFEKNDMKNMHKKTDNSEMSRAITLSVLMCFILCFVSPTCFADTTLTIGGVASLVTQSFKNLAKLITATSYLAGLGFSIGSVMKFRQHKDNPTQIPIGTPIALLFIASALLFLPSILGIAGVTLFGAQGGTVAGPSGIVFS